MDGQQATASYDVVVIGGGAAGFTAAVQAARAGARTALIEKNGVLGGTTVVAGVDFPGLFHAGGKQVISGIGWEAIERTVAKGGAELPDFTQPIQEGKHWEHQIRVNRFLYSAVLDEMCLEAGVDLRFHEMPAAIKVDSNEQGEPLLFTTGKTGLMAIGFKKLVDATGDANIAEMMGYEREREAVLQPGTLVYKLEGYEMANVDRSVLKERYASALAAGEIRITDHLPGEFPFYRELVHRGSASLHIPWIDGSTSPLKSQAEIKAREALLRIVHFLRGIPGCEKLYVSDFANECGIRETWRIIGETRVDAPSYVSGRVWPDAVCYSYYPIDVHQSDSNTTEVRPLTEGVVPTIPYGALIPRGSEHLLAAGRCISGDGIASSAYRVQASCMATGQAAGAAAAIAASRSIPVYRVEVEELRQLLTMHQAIVPEKDT